MRALRREQPPSVRKCLACHGHRGELPRRCAQRALGEGDRLRPGVLQRPLHRREHPERRVGSKPRPPRRPLGVPAVRRILEGPHRARAVGRCHEVGREPGQRVVFREVPDPAPGHRCRPFGLRARAQLWDVGHRKGCAR
eukprot:6187017-Pleurochrysis_carterae.AAC.2